MAFGVAMATLMAIIYVSPIDFTAATSSYVAAPTTLSSSAPHVAIGTQGNRLLSRPLTAKGISSTPPIDANFMVPPTKTTKQGGIAADPVQYTASIVPATPASNDKSSSFWSGVKLLITFITTVVMLPGCHGLALNIVALFKGQAYEEKSKVSCSHSDSFPFECDERRLVGPAEVTARQVSTIAMASASAGLLSGEPDDSKLERVSAIDYLTSQAGTIFLRVLGLGLFTAADMAVGKYLAALGIAFPSVVITLGALFTGLCTLNLVSAKATSSVIQFFTPATAFLARWLPIMFVPSLCNLVNVVSIISGHEIAVLLSVIFVRVIFMMTVGGLVATKLIPNGPSVDDPPAPAASGPPPVGLPGPPLMTVLGAGAWIGLMGVLYLPQFAFHFRYLLGLCGAFLCYAGCQHLQKFVAGRNKVLSKVMQPVVTCTIGTLMGLQLLSFAEGNTLLQSLSLFNTGVQLPYPKGPGDAITFLLTPAVVSMGVGIFQRREIMLKYLAPFSFLVGAQAAGSMIFMAVVLRGLGLSKVLAWSVLANSCTAPLAAEATKALAMGGITSVAIATAVISGVIGAIIGGILFDALNIKGNIPRGVAMGANSHGIGTGVLSAEEPASAPYAAMTFALVGALTVTLASLPAFQALLLAILA